MSSRKAPAKTACSLTEQQIDSFVAIVKALSLIEPVKRDVITPELARKLGARMGSNISARPPSKLAVATVETTVICHIRTICEGGGSGPDLMHAFVTGIRGQLPDWEEHATCGKMLQGMTRALASRKKSPVATTTRSPSRSRPSRRTA